MSLILNKQRDKYSTNYYKYKQMNLFFYILNLNSSLVTSLSYLLVSNE